MLRLFNLLFVPLKVDGGMHGRIQGGGHPPRFWGAIAPSRILKEGGEEKKGGKREKIKENWKKEKEIREK